MVVAVRPAAQTSGSKRVAPYFGITLGRRAETGASFNIRKTKRACARCLFRMEAIAVLPAYQLDLTTPGISPLSARLRKHKRQTPNLRKKARGRPQSWQRLCWRDLNFGTLASLTRFAVVAILFSLSWVKLTQTVVVRREGLRNCLSLLRALAERHAKRLQQLAGAVVVLRRCDDCDVHALNLVDLRIVDLSENQLVAQAERIVAAAVE